MSINLLETKFYPHTYGGYPIEVIEELPDGNFWVVANDKEYVTDRYGDSVYMHDDYALVLKSNVQS